MNIGSADIPNQTPISVADVKPKWPEKVQPERHAPNVVFIVLDDVGFAQTGAYGGLIDTPYIDTLGANGSMYTNFHVTSMCSTTRASLLTGRNHHTVGMGFLADFATGYENARGEVSKSAAMLPEYLKEAGYGTYAVGKWHLTPPEQMSSAGPFDQWPLGRGFDRYYGFLWGEEDQYSPMLWEDNHQTVTPTHDGYHLSEDLVNKACRSTSDHVTSTPYPPFFLYLASGAAPAPHQAPAEYIDRYRGAFDDGWDQARKRILEKQLHKGVVPENTKLAPLNSDVAPWDSLDSDERRLYARMQEVFAGFMTHTDEQIGKLLGFLTRHNLANNTLVVLLSDNGASGEGGSGGSANEYRYFLGESEDYEESLSAIEELGGPNWHNHYPAGWAQAGNTPLRYYKKSTFGGGVRAPLIMSLPGQIRGEGVVRTQFHHVIDIAPTILDVCGIDTPSEMGGIQQLPLHGVSMKYSFADPDSVGKRDGQ